MMLPTARVHSPRCMSHGRTSAERTVAAVLLGTVVFLALPFCSFPARASELPGLGERLEDDVVRARSQFLIERLEDRQTYAKRWYWGWMGIYVLSSIGNGVRAGLADGENARTDYIVTSAKSVIGMAELLLRERNARLGADPVLALPEATPEQRETRMAAAERLLEHNASRARDRYSIWAHVGTVVLNLAGGGALLAVGAEERAAVSVGLGILGGEAFIWTEPAKPARDLEDYHNRFGGDEARLRPRLQVSRSNVSLLWEF